MKANFNFRTKTINALGTEMCNKLRERMNEFTQKEQEDLLGERKAIADFLESLCKENLEKAADENAYVLKEQHICKKEIPVEKEVEPKRNETQKAEETSEKNGMSPSELIACQSQIKAFFYAYDNAKVPEWLIANRTKIEKLFEAYEQF